MKRVNFRNFCRALGGSTSAIQVRKVLLGSLHNKTVQGINFNEGVSGISE